MPPNWKKKKPVGKLFFSSWEAIIGKKGVLTKFSEFAISKVGVAYSLTLEMSTSPLTMA